MRYLVLITFLISLRFFAQDTILPIIKIPPHQITSGEIYKRISQRMIERSSEIICSEENSVFYPLHHQSGISYIINGKASLELTIPKGAILDIIVHEYGTPAKFGDTNSIIVEIESY